MHFAFINRWNFELSGRMIWIMESKKLSDRELREKLGELRKELELKGSYPQNIGEKIQPVGRSENKIVTFQIKRFCFDFWNFTTEILRKP